MYGRHRRKKPKFLAVRGIAVFILALALSVTPFSFVTANTVSANVIDGDKSYTFSMESTDLNHILAQAEEMGLAPLGALDVAELVENTTTVNIRRGVVLSLREAGEETELVAYRGDTLEKALTENSILLKEGDEISPSRDTLITGPISAEIKRRCDVTVRVNGKTSRVSMTGGTVRDALDKAGVKLGEKDSTNYDLDEPLFDKMNIRVDRVVQITITVDGETKSYDVPSFTVSSVLKKLGITVSQYDQINVGLREKVTQGMNIEIVRAKVSEVEEQEEIPYSTEYVDSEELYEGETQVITPGENGKKTVTYRVIEVEGQEPVREVVSENTEKEPVAEVVAKGTKAEEAEEPEYSFVPDAPSQGDSAGTFVDMNGNVVSFSKMLTGTCTAYSVPGGTTSIGMKAEYGVIAVDPNIIPYGTRLYVTSPDGSVVYGYGVAGDTGGAAMAGEIIADLCYNSVEECSIIGRRTMNVYILS